MTSALARCPRDTVNLQFQLLNRFEKDPTPDIIDEPRPDSERASTVASIEAATLTVFILRTAIKHHSLDNREFSRTSVTPRRGQTNYIQKYLT